MMCDASVGFTRAVGNGYEQAGGARERANGGPSVRVLFDGVVGAHIPDTVASTGGGG